MASEETGAEPRHIQVPVGAVVAVLVVLNVYPLFLAAVGAVRFPAFMDMFDELLEGMPLPAVTILMTALYGWLWVLPMGLIVASLLLLVPKRFPIVTASVIAVLSIASASLLKMFLESAMFMPLLKIIECLGG